MSRKKKSVNPFQVGDSVRVRHGVKDADYPDMPLGGWAGTVEEIHSNNLCMIRWTEKTLAAVHTVYKNRCEKDGLEFERCGLNAEDLEPDLGDPLQIEQLQEILTQPLSPDEEDRIRMVFGLTSNDPLPDADDETLQAYQKYLSGQLVFPFKANYTGGYGSPEQVTVLGLGDPDDDAMLDEGYGILCEARLKKQLAVLPLWDLEDATTDPNKQLLDDYSFWFTNWR